MPNLFLSPQSVNVCEIFRRARVQVQSCQVRLVLFLLTVAVLTLHGIPTLGQSSPRPLAKKDVIGLLRGGVSTDTVAGMAKERKIDFEVTPDVEKELRDAGADNELVKVLHDLAPEAPIKRYLAVRNPLTTKGAVLGGLTVVGVDKELAVFSIGEITIRNHMFCYQVSGGGSLEHDKGSLQFPLDHITDVTNKKFKKPYGCARDVKCTDSLEILTKDSKKKFRFMVQNTADQPELGELLLDELHHNQ